MNKQVLRCSPTKGGWFCIMGGGVLSYEGFRPTAVKKEGYDLEGSVNLSGRGEGRQTPTATKG